MAGYIGSRASVVSSGAERKKTFDITGTTTVLTGLSYTPTFVHLFHNGVRLVDGTDYTATDSTSITLTTAAQSGDQVVVVSYATFQAADAYTKAEADAGFVSVAGDTMTGGLTVGGAFTSLGIDDNAAATAVTIDASGNVGIGTASPNYSLTSYKGGVNANYIQVANGSTGAGSGNGALFGVDASGNGAVTVQGVFDYITSVAGVERMRISSSGNVGIGTAAPSAKLSIKGGAANSANLLLTHDTDGTGNYSKIRFQFAEGNTSIASEIRNIQRVGGASGSSLAFFTENTSTILEERMRIDSSGNVALTGNETELKFYSTYTVGSTDRAKIKTVGEGGGSGYGGALTFHTKNSSNVYSERMRIDSSGRLLVGTATPYSGAYRMSIAPDVGTGFIAYKAATAASHVAATFINSNNVGVGGIIFTASGTSYSTSSDYRLKENITPVQGAGDIVKAMRPVTYNFKADSTDWHDGFLAHELQELHPRAVTGSKDAMKDEEYEVTPAVLDEDGVVVTEAIMGTRSVPDYQGVDYSKLTPILTAALQEALNKIDALEARLTALEVTP